MKKASSVKALLCAALLIVIFISMFMPVVTFNSAEKFDETVVGDTKIGWYDVDLEHAGKVKISLASVIFSGGKEADILVELYKLGERKKLSVAEGDLEEAAELQAEIDEIMNDISGTETDSNIQVKLENKKFLRKVALGAAMYNAEKDSSYLTLAVAVSLIALAVLITDIVLKLVKVIKSKLDFNEDVVKSLTDFRLPIVAFILHMFTIQHYIAKTRGIVSLGSGVIIGLIAMVGFAAVRCAYYVLDVKENNEKQYKKTLIKQGIGAGVLIVTVIIALLGMKMSGLMINDMQSHYAEFEARYIYLAIKLDAATAAEKVVGSMNIVVTILAAVPILIYSALGYMLARVGMVEKTRIKKSRKPKTPLGSFYIGFIFVAAAYILSLVLFTVKDSSKRYDMYANCQMSVVFTEYKDEDSKEHKYYNSLNVIKENYEELKDEYSEEYNNAEDKKDKADIKSDIEDIELEIKALEKQINRIESRKKSNVIAIIVLAGIAACAEFAFKMIKYDAEKIADSGKEN